MWHAWSGEPLEPSYPIQLVDAPAMEPVTLMSEDVARKVHRVGGGSAIRQHRRLSLSLETSDGLSLMLEIPDDQEE